MREMGRTLRRRGDVRRPRYLAQPLSAFLKQPPPPPAPAIDFPAVKGDAPFKTDFVTFSDLSAEHEAAVGLAIKEDYLLRAAAAKAGIYGNDAVKAMYPQAKFDSTGEALDGSKRNYTMTFAKGDLPPVNAF